MPALIANGNPTVLGPSSVPEWQDYPVMKNLAERLGLPVFVDNDATADAIGELLIGAGRQLTVFFRSEARRVGTGCCSTCRYRRSQVIQNNINIKYEINSLYI